MINKLLLIVGTLYLIIFLFFKSSVYMALIGLVLGILMLYKARDVKY